jgi:hypothetical protein
MGFGKLVDPKNEFGRTICIGAASIFSMSKQSEGPEPQFENPEESKVEDETISKATPRKQMDRVAEELAEKSSKVEKNADIARPIFSK